MDEETKKKLLTESDNLYNTVAEGKSMEALRICKEIQKVIKEQMNKD